jgi:hypothetical protein
LHREQIFALFDTRAPQAPQRNGLEIFKRTKPAKLKMTPKIANNTKIVVPIASSGELSCGTLKPRCAYQPMKGKSTIGKRTNSPAESKHPANKDRQPLICFGGGIFVFCIRLR